MLNTRVEVHFNKPLSAEKMQGQADGVIESKLVEMGQLLERLVADFAPEGVFGAGGGFKGSIFSETRGTPVRELLVASTAKHAPFVERGRRPGKPPPPEPIRMWVQKKLGIGGTAEIEFMSRTLAALGSTQGAKARRRTAKSLAEQKLDRVTFLVQMKISHRGTTGAAPFFKALQKGRPILEKLANDMGASIVFEWDKP